jgi:hypothetical protein
VNNAGVSVPTGGLQFLIYPGSQQSQFTVYDGTVLTCSPLSAGLSLTLSSDARSVVLQVLSKEPAQVSRDGQTLQKSATQASFEATKSAWRFDLATGFVFIKFPHLGGVTQIQL